MLYQQFISNKILNKFSVVDVSCIHIIIIFHRLFFLVSCMQKKFWYNWDNQIK